MGMVVRTNINALNANRNLGKNSKTNARSLEKLASGFRINRGITLLEWNKLKIVIDQRFQCEKIELEDQLKLYCDEKMEYIIRPHFG